MSVFKSFVAFFTAFITFFCSIFNIPYYATGKQLDLSSFTLTFEENFDTFDTTVWSGHYVYYDKSALRRGGYWNNSMPYAENGNLYIPLMYLQNGIGGTGEGWYSAGIDTDKDAQNGFSQTYGYFECRCILPKCADCWASFWLTNEEVYNVDGNGKDGTEIDVFESQYYGKSKQNCISSDLHYDGYGDAHKALGTKKFLVSGDPYSEFNTYGVEWNENEYIFYINGRETFRSGFGGVSQNPEYLILSLEVDGSDGVTNTKLDKTKTYNFIVDYVRVYQYNRLLEK